MPANVPAHHDLRAHRGSTRAGETEEPPAAAHAVSLAIALQYAAGNRSVARMLAGHGRASSVVLQREPSATTAATEVDLLRGWVASGETRENVLADRVFFHRHPGLAGSRLAPGSDEAREWMEIRQTVVRPALVSPAPPATGPPGPGAPASPDADAPTATSVAGDALTAIGGAVDSAVSAGEDLLQDVADAGADLLGFASGSGAAVGGAVLDFLGIDGDGGSAPGDLQQPEVVLDVPLEADPEHQRGDAYKNQRDNTSTHVGGDVSCSPTSFTMALIDLHGGDEEVVRARTIELIEERGGTTVTGQTEDLVIELLQTVDWPTATTEKPAYFWSPSTWATWARKQYGGNYYKDPNAQQYVASLYTATGGRGAEIHASIHTRDAWAPVVTALREGAYATAEGGFTASGHVVAIVDADDDGVTINDPYGLWLRSAKGYTLKNGSPGGGLDAAAKSEFDRRTTKNPALAQVYERHLSDPPATGGHDAWGERNFYSWDDVADVKLGKWVSVLRSA